MKISGKDKLYISVIAVVLILAMTVCGTVAYLTDRTEEVKNTFTVGNIAIDLVENKGVDEKGNWQHQVVPGVTYPKNPIVSVKDDTNVDTWLFVKFEEKNDAKKYLTYTSLLTTENKWIQGEGSGEGKNGIPTDVWYRKVLAEDTERSWQLLTGDPEKEELKEGFVTVKDTVTESDMDKAKLSELVYTAYAIQASGFDAPGVAWEELNKE